MLDSETTVFLGDGPPRVHMRERGWDVIMVFGEPVERLGDGDLVEVRLVPDSSAPDRANLSELMPRGALYEKYARATMQHKFGESRALLEAILETRKPRSALPDEFYRAIATTHSALLTTGERHPIKAIATMHAKTISAASRWVTEAKRRGYIEDADRG
jgi:hypothetical protein